MARKRGMPRKATGGKAPRKQLSIPQLREWEDNNPLLQDNDTEEKEIQTFPSTSDVQVQNCAEMKTSQSQTDYATPIIKIEKNLEKANEIIEYLKDENVLLRQKLGRAAKLERGLINSKTSLCTKDCCKDSL